MRCEKHEWVDTGPTEYHARASSRERKIRYVQCARCPQVGFRNPNHRGASGPSRVTYTWEQGEKS